jgi:3-oxoacyl-[acyl-carrier protein] reductase
VRLENKVAVVTGSSSGIGEAIALAFAANGAAVVVNYARQENAAQKVLEKIEDADGKGLVVGADVSDPKEVEAMIQQATDAFGRLDIMVNNAGYTHRNSDMLDVDEATFDLITAVNMKAIYHSTLAVVPIMERQGGGVILTTASTAGLRPRPGLTWYNASKGWTITATKSMAVELAPKNIRVNCLCPVAGETGMLEKFMGEDTPERRAQFRASIPLGRLSTPLDIANAALWLCSDEAEFITGVALEVDGGRCI